MTLQRSFLLDRIFWWRRAQYQGVLRQVFWFYAWLFTVWGLYRLLFRLPLLVEELILKPLVFFAPLLSLLAKEHKTLAARLSALGMQRQNLSIALVFGVALGLWYFFAGRTGRLVVPGVVQLDPVLFLLVAFLTALWEQAVFSGYILQKLQAYLRDEWRSVTLTAVLFGLIHLPTLVFARSLPLADVLANGLLLFVLGFGNSVLMLRTRNLIAPILSQTLWGMAVVVFG